MVNLHSQFGWALTRHRDTPQGISVMVFQISSDAEGRPKLNMGWNHLAALHMDQEGIKEEASSSLTFTSAS